MDDNPIAPLDASQLAPMSPPVVVPIPQDMLAADPLAIEQQLVRHMTVPLVLETLADPVAEINAVVSLLRQLPNHPSSIFAWFNLGRLQGHVGNTAGAIAAYDAVLEKKPDFGPAQINKAVMLELSGNVDAAIDLLANPTTHPADVRLAFHNQRGRMLEVAGRLQEAEAELLHSLMLDPAQTDVIHHFTHLRAKQCRWPVLVNLPGLPAAVQQRHMGSLGTIAHIDDPALHHDIACAWIERKYPAANSERIALPARPKLKGRRPRVGFLSSDLRLHVVSILALEFFENLDRDRLETFAFDFSPQDGTPFRAHVLKCFEHHVPIHTDSDAVAAGKIAEAGLDVLIDLNGLTANARPGIIRFKPAPTIVSWLGSLTTSGMDEIDYYMADSFVLTEENKRHFSEKPLFLETGVHLNSSHRLIAPTPKRSDFGLPEKAFVYCAFNNNYKINPAMLDDWVEIVSAVPGSILWLQADNEWSRENLTREALARGLTEDRIVFATRIQPDQYLARFRLADLYLDTFPCNAGATAVDCLFTGLPILTMAGRSVPARTAAGVVTHAGLPELIAADRAAYRATAIAWGKDRAAFAKIRAKMDWESLKTSKLFDSVAKAREFEAVMARLAAGEDVAGEGEGIETAADASPAHAWSEA